MYKWQYRNLLYVLCLQLILAPAALAQEKRRYSGWDTEPAPTKEANEFVFRNKPNDILMPVYLLGAVNRPGLYHVPIKTNLVSLLALSGGTAKDTELDSVVINHAGKNYETEIDLSDSLASNEMRGTPITHNDIIYVKPKPKMFSDNTVLTITILSGIASILLAGALIHNTFQD